MFWLSLLFIIGFMLVHVFTDYIKFLSREPKNRLMSVVSGGSIAYVFLHLVPELTHYQEVAEKAELPKWMEQMDYVTYLATLAGLAFFYGIDQLSEISRKKINEVNTQNAQASKFSFLKFLLLPCTAC